MKAAIKNKIKKVIHEITETPSCRNKEAACEWQSPDLYAQLVIGNHPITCFQHWWFFLIDFREREKERARS